MIHLQAFYMGIIYKYKQEKVHELKTHSLAHPLLSLLQKATFLKTVYCCIFPTRRPVLHGIFHKNGALRIGFGHLGLAFLQSLVTPMSSSTSGSLAAQGLQQIGDLRGSYKLVTSWQDEDF